MSKTHPLLLTLCTILLLSSCSSSENIPPAHSMVCPDTETASAEIPVPFIPEETSAKSAEESEPAAETAIETISETEAETEIETEAEAEEMD